MRKRTTTDRHDLLPGTLDMLVLKVLSHAPMHGYGIAQQIQRLSKDALKVEEGSLYPALQRIRQREWISAEWKLTPNNQRARYYTITPAGRRHLGAELIRFTDLIAVLGDVLGTA